MIKIGTTRRKFGLSLWYILWIVATIGFFTGIFPVILFSIMVYIFGSIAGILMFIENEYHWKIKIYHSLPYLIPFVYIWRNIQFEDDKK